MEKNFYARINAIIKDFERGVRKAQRLAKTAVPNEIETDVKANITRFQRALTRAKAMAKKWREHEVKIDGDASSLNRTILKAKARLATLFDKTVKVKFKTEGLTRTQILTRALNESLTDFGDKMDALATKIRTFGTVFSQHIRGVIIASFQALIPVIAGVVPVIMAIGNAIKVVSGGAIALAGALSIAAAGVVAFGAMGISAIKMLNDGTLEATKETERYQSALEGVKDTWVDIIKQNQAQIFNTLANALDTVKVAMKGLTPFIDGVAKKMEQASKSVLDWAENSSVAKKFFKEMGATGVDIFGDLMRAAGQFGSGLVSMFTQLMPLFKWSSQWLQRLGENFNKWVNSAKGQNAIKDFMNYTKQNLPIIGNIFKNTFAGINNLLKAFGQNSTDIFRWLEEMTAKFRDWSEAVGKSEGWFKKFVKYVEENGPVIMKLIGDIVRILVAFGKAMAPIASALLKLIGKIAEFTASLLENYPNVARFFGILGILGGAFWALLAPIMFISSVLTNVFGKSLFDVGKHVFKFIKNSSLLRGAFDLLKSPLSKLTQLFPILGSALAGISAPVLIVIGVIAALVGIIVWLWKTNEDFRNAVITAWETIRDTVGGAIQGLIGWLQDLWSKIQETLQPIMPVLQQLGEIVNQVLGVIFIAAINGLITMITGLWTAVKIAFTAIGTIISSVIQLIVGIFTAFIQFLSGDFSGAWQTLQTTISNAGETIWQGLVSIWNQIQQFLFDTYSRITGQTVSSWSQIWQSIVSYVTNIWNSVVQWFSQVVSTIGAKMGAALVQIIAKGAQWVSSIQQAMINFLNAVVQGFLNVVRACVDGMQNAVNAIRNFFSQFSEVGSYLMEGLANGIRAGISWVVDAAKGVAQNAINAAKNVLGIHSPSRVFKGIGQFLSQGLGLGILNHGYKAINAVRDISKRITNAFDANLVPSFNLDGLGSSITGEVDGYITDDVRHSIQENMRPIVNIEVRNEGDLEYIHSAIRDKDAKEYYT
ncbi:phage tail protein [Staphylococcus felis]|uniref:phage tail protein n=1 Tax=Staphylococcus felis TaxID=46127 RepID=UPI0021D2D811|nr:terminase [Staphylococcus felis]UXR86171.1 terminase [Staphylococcus felis]